MHPGYQIPGIQHHQQSAPENNTCAPVMLSMNQTHFLDPIHTLPAAASAQQRLFLAQEPHFLPPHSRPNHHHHYADGSSSSAYFPAVNFKLGLNEFCARNNNDYKDDSTSIIVCSVNGGGHDGNLLRGSEQYEFPEARQSSLGMLHCWQNQQDSADKQPPSFWEHLPSEVSNENSEIIDRSQENMETNNVHKERQQVLDDHHLTLTTCLDSKSRPHFGELEAIYKPLGTTTTTDSNKTGQRPNYETNPPATGPERGSSEPGEALPSSRLRKRKKKRKEEKSEFDDRYAMSPTAEFFENLVKEVMDHQESMHEGFARVIERLEDERRVREQEWRKQESARHELESEARAKDKASAKNREAVIVSYLEKITGERINFSNFDPMEITPTNTH